MTPVRTQSEMRSAEDHSIIRNSLNPASGHLEDVCCQEALDLHALWDYKYHKITIEILLEAEVSWTYCLASVSDLSQSPYTYSKSERHTKIPTSQERTISCTRGFGPIASPPMIPCT